MTIQTTEELPLEIVVEAPHFDGTGSSLGIIELDPAVFGITPNLSVLHQVITGIRSAYRVGTASTKTRAEVRGGGRKPWRQKGTGRARHGSIRSPLWVGGGVAHGPKPRKYYKQTPKKMKRLALRSALSARASEQAVYVIEPPEWTTPKTKTAAQLLATLEISPKILLVLGDQDSTMARSFRNLTNIKICPPQRLTAYEVLWSSVVLLTSDTLPDIIAQATGIPSVSEKAEEGVEDVSADTDASNATEEQPNTDEKTDAESTEAEITSDNETTDLPEAIADEPEPSTDFAADKAETVESQTEKSDASNPEGTENAEPQDPDAKKETDLSSTVEVYTASNQTEVSSADSTTAETLTASAEENNAEPDTAEAIAKDNGPTTDHLDVGAAEPSEQPAVDMASPSDHSEQAQVEPAEDAGGSDDSEQPAKTEPETILTDETSSPEPTESSDQEDAASSDQSADTSETDSDTSRSDSMPDKEETMEQTESADGSEDGDSERETTTNQATEPGETK